MTQLCLFIMKKMLIKILVSWERAVSKIEYLFCYIMRDMKQYFAKAEELFQHLLAGFFFYWPLLLDRHYFNVSWSEGENGSGLSRWRWQSLTWPCCSLFALFNALAACTQSESCRNNNATSCNSFSSVLMKIKVLTLWIHLGLTN